VTTRASATVSPQACLAADHRYWPTTAINVLRFLLLLLLLLLLTLRHAIYSSVGPVALNL